MFNKGVIFALVAMGFVFAGSANAEDCAMKQMASLNIQTLPDGTIAVPAAVDGHEGLFIVRLDDRYTKVVGAVLNQLSVGAVELPLGGNIEGSRALLTVPHFKIANLDIAKVPVLWIEHDFPETGVIGSLGTDLLGEFDVELDLRHSKLNLFSPDHCPGHVVYWTNSVAAAIPFDFDAMHTVVFDADLDGKPIKVGISTLPGHGTLRPDIAYDVLGLPAPPSHPGTAIAVDKAPPVTQTFKTLTIGGITISNPKIDIAGVTIEGLKCDGQSHSFHGMYIRCLDDVGFHIRLSEISALRMYFAFHEKMLYVTPASASQ
jgi:hypothetical protein